MNKTKRKIFETSMKLFAEKGYDATSIEEITATVGVAKGTLYYHFSSKEEIFKFKNNIIKKIKLVNDILTISILLGDLLDINIDFKDKNLKFQNDFNIETVLGDELLTKR